MPPRNFSTALNSAPPGGSDHGGDEKLPAELERRAKLVFVIQPAEQGHPEGSSEDRGKLGGALFKAVEKFLGGIRAEEVQLQDKERAEQRDDKAGEDGESADERDGAVVDFPLTGIVHQPRAQAPRAPERQGGGRDQRGGEGREQVKVQRKGHGRSEVETGFTMRRR